jgi:hypothetical protein
MASNISNILLIIVMTDPDATGEEVVPPLLVLPVSVVESILSVGL